jgi:outer membrane immunogenic protein
VTALMDIGSAHDFQPMIFCDLYGFPKKVLRAGKSALYGTFIFKSRLPSRKLASKGNRMKKNLSLAVMVLITSTSMGLSAQGQYYNASSAKGDAQLLNDARAMKDEEPAAPSPQSPNMAPPSTIEPYTGSDRDGPYDDFKGFYGGGDIGYGIDSAEVNDPLGPDGDVGLKGVNGDLFLGYGFEHSFSWLGGYAGLELGYEWSGVEGSLAGVSYEKNQAWNVSFRPGLSLHQDTLGYGIIGYSRGEFSAAGEETDLDGFILGAGAEFDTNTAFKTRLEYTYTNYEDGNFAGTGFEPQENNIKLGALFRF